MPDIFPILAGVLSALAFVATMLCVHAVNRKNIAKRKETEYKHMTETENVMSIRVSKQDNLNSREGR